MTAKAVVSGVGARYAEAFALDPTTGLPAVGFNSGTLAAGTLIQGIKKFDYTNPAPQRIQHYGEDRPFAQDSLPPAEVGAFQVQTAKTNLVLDAFSEGTNVVVLDSVVQARLGNSDKRGSEPQLMINVFRQALDTLAGSPTFGKLRQWHAALIPSTRLINNLQGFDQAATVKTYEGIPTPVSYTPWNAAFDVATWGGTRGEYVELVFDNKPVIACGLGNGTLTVFALPKPPIDVAHTHIWADGTLQTVNSVNSSTTNPSATLASAPGNGKLVFAIIEHNQPS